MRIWNKLWSGAADRTVDSLTANVRYDQLFDIRRGTFIAMPINSMLSCLILFDQYIQGRLFYGLSWFLIINLINLIRLLMALRIVRLRDQSAEKVNKQVARYLWQYKYWAFISGTGWSLVAVLTDGYNIQNEELYLIIVAGICAGAVTSISSVALVSINFIIMPLIVGAICLFLKGQFTDYILVFSICLFTGGLMRGAVLGQQRFVEASRLKHEANRVAVAMERMSQEDPLTGLLNRRGLENAVQLHNYSLSSSTIMLIDLDGFKAVNDTYGHRVGDDLLVSIAGRLRVCSPDYAVIARIGGDEFALLYPTILHEGIAEDLAERIIRALSEPYNTGSSVQIGACIGIYCSERTNLADMLLSADTALYEAKDSGRNKYYVFDEVLKAKQTRLQTLEKDMHLALESNEIASWFQPITDLHTRRLTGFEALLRWNHTIYGAVPAPEIVQIARDSGLLEKLTHNVFRNCCLMIVALREVGCERVQVAMNLSSRELASANIERMIVNGFCKYNIPFSSFEIEITEDAPIDHFTVEDTLTRLASRGISIAIDDFGTGFSTLASLKSGMINKVKIDRSFISRVAVSLEDQQLVKAVVDLGLAMKLEVVVEGVENDISADVLKSLGCRKAQGFLFSAAMPPQVALDYAIKAKDSQQLSVCA